jgi:hypothetical protein
MNYQKERIDRSGRHARCSLWRGVRRAYLFGESWVPFVTIAVLAVYIGRLIEMGKMDAHYGVGIIVFTLVPLAMHARNVREFNRLHETIREGGMPTPTPPPSTPSPSPGATK